MIYINLIFITNRQQHGETTYQILHIRMFYALIRRCVVNIPMLISVCFQLGGADPQFENSRTQTWQFSFVYRKMRSQPLPAI
jgi:hypothetical protein